MADLISIVFGDFYGVFGISLATYSRVMATCTRAYGGGFVARGDRIYHGGRVIVQLHVGRKLFVFYILGRPEAYVIHTSASLCRDISTSCQRVNILYFPSGEMLALRYGYRGVLTVLDMLGVKYHKFRTYWTFCSTIPWSWKNSTIIGADSADAVATNLHKSDTYAHIINSPFTCIVSYDYISVHDSYDPSYMEVMTRCDITAANAGG